MSTTLFVIFSASLAVAPAPLQVVTTTQDLASIAQAVGGDRARVSALIVGARDPHRIEAKPSYMSRVSKADLFIAVGLDLEVGYESAILAGARNPKVAVGAPGHLYAFQGGARILDRPTAAVTRAHGDVHPYGNPHYWLDPYNGRIIARTIAERMAKLRPSEAQAFRANANAFIASIDDRMFGQALVQRFGADKLWSWDNQGQLIASLRQNNAINQLGGWAGRLAAHRGRPIVTYHRTWTYFADRFDLRIVEELEPKPGLEPTPGHLRQVQQVGKDQGVKAIMQEPYYSTKPSRFVASRIGAQVVLAPASVGQDPAARDYLSLFDTIVARLAQALGA